MLFIVWTKWEPGIAAELLQIWRTFKIPEEIKVIGRYFLIGRHITVAIIDAPSEESLIKLTFPFRKLGTPHIVPAMSFETAIEKLTALEKA